MKAGGGSPNVGVIQDESMNNITDSTGEAITE